MEMLPPSVEPHLTHEPDGKRGKFDQASAFVVTVSRVFNWIAGLGLFAMFALVVSDIIAIKVFARPIPGGIELTAFFAVVAIGFAIAFTQVVHGHVAVDFVVDHMPQRLKYVVGLVTIFLSIVVIGLLSFYLFRYANLLRRTGEVSMTQNIPFYPFVYGLAVCFVLTFVVLVFQLVTHAKKAGE